MKSIKLIINKLGAIENSKIQIKPLMILSGESGVGKSYLAILIHYVYKILVEFRLNNFFIDKKWDFETISKENPKTGSFNFDSKELIEWINNDAIDYLRNALGNSNLTVDVKLELPIKPTKFTLSYRTMKMGLEGKEESYLVFKLNTLEDRVFRIPADSKEIKAIPWVIILQHYLKETILGNDKKNQTIALVPGRGALLNIPLTIQEKIKKSSDIYAEFLNDWDIVRSMATQKNADEELLQTLREINGGSIMLDNNQQLLYKMTSGKELPITAAASSVKELAPLDMLLTKCPVDGLSLLFEEPEAHIHPSKQVAIADFIIQAINKGAHMQITTHSDYFLRRINDRIFLHDIKRLDENKYNELIKQFHYSDLTIDNKKIGAYLLRRESDGAVKIVTQKLSDGIPYESFYNVLKNDIGHSLDIQMNYSMLKHDTK